MHLNFGIDMINQIKIENPHLWDDQMRLEAAQMILEGTTRDTICKRHNAERNTWYECRHDGRVPPIIVIED